MCVSNKLHYCNGLLPGEEHHQKPTISSTFSQTLNILGLILEHFLKFLLKCFLRASEKQRKQKTSAKFMHA